MSKTNMDYKGRSKKVRRHEGMSDGPLPRKKCKSGKCKNHGR